MALRDDTHRQVAGALLDALELGGDARMLAATELQRLAHVLQEPTAWTVVGHGRDATLLFLTGDALFSIHPRTPYDDDPRFVVTCRAADVTAVRYARAEQLVSWHFELRVGEPVDIEGSMAHAVSEGEPEPYDRAEAFARMLAARGGWNTEDRVDPELVRDQEPFEDELPDAGWLGRPDRRGQQVTDIWGRPKRPKGRGR